MIELHNNDCLNVMNNMIENNIKVDLIVTDPPYEINNTTTGSDSELNKSIQKMNDELANCKTLTKGISNTFLEKMLLLQDKVNIYIWCNHIQIPQYIDFFVSKNKCKFDILIWNKTNAIPTFCNKYMTDKEYCLYFRKSGFCNPESYEDAKTIFYQPINITDKKNYHHPTIKPLNIIKTIIRNSSKEGDIIFDPFMGSGTTGVASVTQNRKFIGVELDEEYFKISQLRLKEATTENKMKELF